MMLRSFSASFLLLASGCATMVSAREEIPDPALAKALVGKMAGTPRSCISLNDTRASTTYRGAVVYRVSGRLSYLNDLGQCPFLRNNNILVTNVRGSQICRGDIVNMVDRSSLFPSGSCSFSDFIPYQSPAK